MKKTPFELMSAEQMVNDLVGHYGSVMTGFALVYALGYRNESAFRQSISRKTVPVDVFSIQGRWGKFAQTEHVAKWLVDKRNEAALKWNSELNNLQPTPQ